MINLIFAAKNGVLDTDIVVETVSVTAVSADRLAFISKLDTVLDSFDAATSLEEKL
jgi:hypothetical protein